MFASNQPLSASSANAPERVHPMTKTFAFLLCATLPIACGDGTKPDQPDAGPTPDAPSNACAVTPGPWAAPNFAPNTTAALALRAQLDVLTGAMTMRGAEQGTVVVDDVADLTAVYNAGTPALSSSVHAGFSAVVDDAFAEFVALIAVGPRDLIDDTGWNPGAAGGLFAPMRRAGFNTGGIEVRQIVDKGLFAGGALYAFALKQTEGTIDEADIDAIAAAWGSNATLDQATKTDSANYSHTMGFHGKIAKSLADAKAYLADPKCSAERDAALVAVFRQWEQSMIARTVFYSNAGVTKLATATTDDLRADALHEFAEGLGLAIGFHGLPSPATGPLANAGRKITDADIEAILTALGVNRTDLAASTIGAFVTDTTAFQTGVTAAENRVKQVYQLTDADIAAYRTPTAG
jgi:hypothetical protein